MAVMIEHFAGHFPFWLSPTQVAVVPVNVDAHGDYTQEVSDVLQNAGYRIKHYSSNDSLGKRIRQAKSRKRFCAVQTIFKVASIRGIRRRVQIVALQESLLFGLARLEIITRSARDGHGVLK